MMIIFRLSIGIFLRILKNTGTLPIGSIIIIDNNFFKGTWVEWIEIVDGKRNVEKIDITQPVVGKGSLVWHFIVDKMDEDDNNWEMLYPTEISWGVKKLILKKIK